MSMTSNGNVRVAEIEARLAELNAAQAATPGWGAAVGARHEEIVELERELRQLRAESSPVRMGASPCVQYAVTPAERLILDERRRQISAEGYSHAHDDAHADGALAIAAACFADFAGTQSAGRSPNVCLRGSGATHVLWPWEGDWKPKDALRNLTIAGALIIAEIERLQRAAARAADADLSQTGVVR